jgi:signal transduction histidine kinase
VVGRSALGGIHYTLRRIASGFARHLRFMRTRADITQRPGDQIALDLLTARFNFATGAAHVGIFERVANEQEIWWNDVMYQIFDQDPASFRPSVATWLALIDPQDRERMRASISTEGTRRPRAALTNRYRIMRPDGTIRHVEGIGSTDWVANRVAGIVLDITARVKAEERERELQQQLRVSSHQAGMAEIAAGVLHNVGNVLNSLGIANSTVLRELKALRLDGLRRASSSIRDHRDTLARFLAEDERGRHLPDYLAELAEHLSCRVRTAQAEIHAIDQLLHHLSNIVSAHQVLAGIGGLREPADLRDLAEVALRLQAPERVHIEVVRCYEDLPLVTIDRDKVLQVLVNLLANARDAIQASGASPGRITVRLRRDGDYVLLSIEDSGVGMCKEVLSHLWQFGFTTKLNGHGFGLHNSANAARSIGATLEGRSDGPGKGSRFTLRLPADGNSQTSRGAAT